MKLRFLCTLLAGASALVHAYPRSDLPSIKFTYNDWELACDNTRTCRAAGYHAEDDGPNASILLTRRAGADQDVQVQLQLAEDPDRPAPATVQMAIAGRDVGPVRIDADTNTGSLSPAQVRALLPALLKDATIAWQHGKDSWTVSTAGANAVLLKMDDFQGRVDTVGALVRKGKKSEAGVLPALPKPVVTAGPVMARQAVVLSASEQARLLAELRKASGADECELLDAKDGDAPPLEVERLTKDKLVVSHLCWRGAYNSGDGVWVTEAKPPYAPVLVTTSSSGYADGVIESGQKGRGIADCMALSTWVWDGRAFAQTLEQTTGMCRQVAVGGAWELPTLVAEVRRHK